MQSANVQSKMTIKRLLIATLAASVLAVPTAIVAEAPASAKATCKAATISRDGIDTLVTTSCQGTGQVVLTFSSNGLKKQWTWYERGGNKQFRVGGALGFGKAEFSYV